MNSEAFPNFTQIYRDFLAKGDPRVATWPMMDSPIPGLTLVVMYLFFVKVLGPAWMRDQKPFRLRYLMVAYNFILVAVSAWLFVNFGMLGWFTTYSWRCEPVDYSYNNDAVRMAEMGWYFYITKFVEFADTIFFVLRKKDSQISSLHVFHHSLVPITLWFGIKYGAGGYNSIFAFLNSFVHMFMYAYYGLAALGPSYQKYLWWKKYLTIIQMIQFGIVFVFMLQLMVSPQCRVSQLMLYLNFIQAIIFFGLFLNFFRGAYQRRHQRRQEQQQQHHHQLLNGNRISKQTSQCVSGDSSIRSRHASVHSSARCTDVHYVEAVTTPA